MTYVCTDCVVPKICDDCQDMIDMVLCDNCREVCDATDAVALDSGLALCGSVYGNGCAEQTLSSVKPNPHSLNWELFTNGGTRRYRMEFGVLNGEPCAAVIDCDSSVVFHVPRDILAIASTQGWQ